MTTPLFDIEMHYVDKPLPIYRRRRRVLYDWRYISEEMIRHWDWLAGLSREIDRRGYPPSVREMEDAWGLGSSYSSHYRLRVLERRGWIHTGLRDQVRSIRITPQGRRQMIEYIRWQINQADGDCSA